MRGIAVLGRQGLSSVLLLTLLLALLTIPASQALASAEALVTAPPPPSFALSTLHQEPGDFVISGFGESDTILVAIGFVNPPAGVSFDLPTHTRLTESFGYTFSGGKTQISFTGTMADANTALAAMRVSTGAVAGDITIRVSASTNKANVFYNPITGHYYQYFLRASTFAYHAGDVSNSAVHLAESQTLFGVKGYLATITSAQEQAFIFSNVDARDFWIGGSDAFEPLKERVSGFSGETTQVGTEGKWYWIAGPDAGTNFWIGATTGTWVHRDSNEALPATVAGNIPNARYENWCGGNAGVTSPSDFTLKASGTTPRGPRAEPNDYGGAEHYLLEKWLGAPCWNDWGRTADGVQGGYLVEYSENWGMGAAGAWNGPRGSFASAGSDFIASATVSARIDNTPRNVVVSSTTPTSATLSWAAPAAGSVTSYTVTASPGSASCDRVSLTSCTVSGLAPNTSHAFTVEALFSDGSTKSALAVSATTGQSARCTSLSSFQENDFRLLENASLAGSTVTLTQNAGNQKGGVWSQGRVNLASNFCVTSEVYLGANDAGADGMAFVFQPLDSGTLTSGGGLGYAGIDPSFAVEIDTFRNPPEQAEDHIALMKDGNSAIHDAWGARPGAGPVALTNVEDGRWRPLVVEWDAAEKEMSVHFDGVTRFSGVSADLIAYFSASNGFVYWGFTAATGGSTNLQQVRNIQYSATPRTNVSPQFVNPPRNQTILVGSENILTVGISDDSTTQAQWQLARTVADPTIFTSGPTFEKVSATSARLRVAADSTVTGSSLITLSITDADGSTTLHSFTLTVATVLPLPPAPPSVPSAGPAPSASPIPAAPTAPARVAPRSAPTPAALTGPVLRGSAPPVASATPSATVNGRPEVVTSTVTGSSGVSLRAGSLTVGMTVPQNQGGVTRQGTSTQVNVQKGARTPLQGSGVLPGSTVQVFLPLQGGNAKEIGRIASDSTGSFSGNALFATGIAEAPMPVGRQVLQVVSVAPNGQQTVVEMTINIGQSAPAPESNRQTQQLPALAPGASLATEAGIPVSVRVNALEEQKQVTVEGDGWSMAVDVTGEGGTVRSTEGSATMDMVRNETALVSGSGFLPGSRADVWLFSTPTLLGTVTIDAEGNFVGEINVDPNAVAVGEHTLQVQAVGQDGYVRAANVGVVVSDPVTEVAVSTYEVAGTFLRWLWLLIALLVTVAVIVGIRYSRRSRA